MIYSGEVEASVKVLVGFFILNNMETKICPKCGESKELNSENFYNSKQTKSGYRTYCKLCVNTDNKTYNELNPKQLINRVMKSRNRCDESKEKHVNSSALWRKNNKETYKNSILKRKYGITFTEFKEMFEIQESKCKICQKELELLDKNTHVDHCHFSGKVRGILCSRCNLTLGQIKDSIVILENAIKYLKSNQE